MAMSDKPGGISEALTKYTESVRMGSEHTRKQARVEFEKSLKRWRKDGIIIALSKLPRQVHARHASKVELCIRPLMVKARVEELSQEKS